MWLGRLWTHYVASFGIIIGSISEWYSTDLSHICPFGYLGWSLCFYLCLVNQFTKRLYTVDPSYTAADGLDHS